MARGSAAQIKNQQSKIKNENTEVLVSRSRGRTSRALVVVLVLTLAAGVFAAFHKIHSPATAASPLLAVEKTVVPPVSLQDTHLVSKVVEHEPVLLAAQPVATRPVGDEHPVSRKEPIAEAPATDTARPLADGQARFD